MIFVTYICRKEINEQASLAKKTKNMIKLKQAGQTLGYCTSEYEVEMSEEYTVAELIGEILEAGECGYIFIQDVHGWLYTISEYKREVIKKPFESKFSNIPVKLAKANRVYSRMDYNIFI